MKHLDLEFALSNEAAGSLSMRLCFRTSTREIEPVREVGPEVVAEWVMSPLNTSCQGDSSLTPVEAIPGNMNGWYRDCAELVSVTRSSNGAPFKQTASCAVLEGECTGSVGATLRLFVLVLRGLTSQTIPMRPSSSIAMAYRHEEVSILQASTLEGLQQKVGLVCLVRKDIGCLRLKNDLGRKGDAMVDSHYLPYDTGDRTQGARFVCIAYVFVELINVHQTAVGSH